MTAILKAGVGLVVFLCLGFMALVMMVGGAVGGGTMAAEAGQACQTGTGPPAVSAAVANVPGVTVAGYSGDQLAIAAQIMQAGLDRGMGVRGQTIGVMTGMGESSLTNVMHGDAVGPDSIGVFQQRANGAWGSLGDRTDPYKAAGHFFDALNQVPGWQAMTPTAAAHAVQRNADPFYYTRFWDPAVQVVQALAGTSVQVAVAAGTGDQVCTGSTPGQVAAGTGGWVNPVPGARLTSGFGNRGATSVSAAQFHAGQDLAAPLGTPIYAAADGTVISSGPASGFGDWIRIDHGGGVITVYGHMYAADLMVRVGDRVTAGQQVARVGSNGQSSGPHCHFEVHVNGTPVDPGPFMAAKGATL